MCEGKISSSEESEGGMEDGDYDGSIDDEGESDGSIDDENDESSEDDEEYPASHELSFVGSTMAQEGTCEIVFEGQTEHLIVKTEWRFEGRGLELYLCTEVGDVSIDSTTSMRVRRNRGIRHLDGSVVVCHEVEGGESENQVDESSTCISFEPWPGSDQTSCRHPPRMVVIEEEVESVLLPKFKIMSRSPCIVCADCQ